MLALSSCQDNIDTSPTPPQDISPTPGGLQVSPDGGDSPDLQTPPTGSASAIEPVIHADRLAGLNKADVDKELGETGETLPGLGTPDSGEGFSMQMVSYKNLGIGAFFKEDAEIITIQLYYSGEKYSDEDLFKYLDIAPSASMKKITNNGYDLFENPTDKIPQIMHGSGENGMYFIYVQYILID